MSVEAYPLESLLTVRYFREEEAKRSVRYAELAVREAEELVVKRRTELEEFRIWRAEEENRRYDSIMYKTMTMRALDNFKAGLAQLAALETQKEEAILTAQKDVAKAQTALEKAREAAKLALKNTTKIQAHKDIWSEEAKKEAEHREDLEMEEFRPISRLGAEAEGEDA